MMKKTITAFICSILLISTMPSSMFASEYQSLIDNADLIVDEDETYIKERIADIEETHNYSVTLVSGEFQSEEAFDDYVNNFSEYDSEGDGTILIIGEYGDSYIYYSLPYGTYSNLLNDAIFADFEEFDASAETYIESYEMYVTLVQIFLEEQASQTTTEVPDKTAGDIPTKIFDVAIFDEANILSEQNKAYFEKRITDIHVTHNYRITLSTKDFDYAQYYPDYEAYYDELIALTKQETAHNGSVIVFAPTGYKDFEFMNLHYGEHGDVISDTMYSFYEIEDYAKEDEDTAEDMCFYLFDVALNWIESALEEENKPPVKSVEEFVGIGGTIDGYDPMIDAAELFTDDEETALFTRIDEIHELYDFDVTLITMNEVPNGDSLQYYFDWYEGLDPTRDGLVFGVSMDPDNREYWTSARQYGIEVLTEDAHHVLNRDVPPILTEGDYFEAFNLYLDYTEEFLESAKKGKLYSEPMGMFVIIIFIIGLPLVLAYIIAWLIVKFVFISQMKTAVIKNEAKDFMRKDSLVLTVNSDVFSHETDEWRYDPPTSSNDDDSGSSSSDGYGGKREGSGGSF